MLETKFSESELEASFKWAFADKKKDYILFDGHSARSRFLVAALDLGLKKGFLYEDEATGRLHSDSQWTSQAYRLTPEGKRYFGLK